MKRHVLKFDRFLVWTFKMDRGERKLLKPIELNRGLTDKGPHTISPISVFVSGSFNMIVPQREPWLCRAGTGGYTKVDCDSLHGQMLVALEDGSEYHCITPRDKQARYWNRHVYTMPAGDVIIPINDSYVYVANGKLAGIDEKLINIQKRTVLVAEVDTTIAVMW